MTQRLPYRLRPGKVRASKRGEERDPDWRPFELTEELVGRVERTNLECRRFWDEEGRRVAEEVAADPEGPFKEYNAATQALKAEATRLPHSEVKARLRELSQAQGLMFSDEQLELLSRLMKDKDFYRRHPVRAVWWLVRYSRPETFKRRWAELRTGHRPLRRVDKAAASAHRCGFRRSSNADWRRYDRLEMSRLGPAYVCLRCGSRSTGGQVFRPSRWLGLPMLFDDVPTLAVAEWHGAHADAPRE